MYILHRVQKAEHPFHALLTTCFSLIISKPDRNVKIKKTILNVKRVSVLLTLLSIYLITVVETDHSFVAVLCELNAL
jgi:hypothetical protein